jgi:hypothetical protein
MGQSSAGGTRNTFGWIESGFCARLNSTMRHNATVSSVVTTKRDCRGRSEAEAPGPSPDRLNDKKKAFKYMLLFKPPFLWKKPRESPLLSII